MLERVYVYITDTHNKARCQL